VRYDNRAIFDVGFQTHSPVKRFQSWEVSPAR
jgi:hypothetical protein